MHTHPSEHRAAIARDAVTAYVALGANLGDAVAALQQAAAALAHLPLTRLLQASSVYKTAPIDTDSVGDTAAPGGDYFNAVVALETGLTAPALLDQLQQLEQQAGRERPYRNAPRTLDLDVLLYGDLVGDFDGLVLPRAEILKNAFVLWPLSLMAPERVHPEVGKTFAALWRDAQIDQVLAPVAFEWRGRPLTPDL